jgi:hypothetical protein
MGRYAQARRRGRGAPVTGALGPPPAPGFTNEQGQLLQTASGLDDTGGEVHLWFGPTSDGPWYFTGFDYWAAVHDWGATYEFDPGWYATTEAGNGVVYAGESALSAAIHLVE